jgi:protein-S-isoprenylcysteine O-methyltransferase Ste14
MPYPIHQPASASRPAPSKGCARRRSEIPCDLGQRKAIEQLPVPVFKAGSLIIPKETNLISGYLWTGFFIFWMLWAIRTKPTERRESIGSRLSYTLLVAAGFYLLLAYPLRPFWLRRPVLPPDRWVKELAAGITAAGLLFAIWARLHLGGNWSGTVTMKVGHELVRSGPYRWVRHPIYSGLLLAVLGTAMERRQVRGFVALALIYAGFFLKIRKEEQFMNTLFGAGYEEYRRATGALIPRPTMGKQDTHS